MKKIYIYIYIVLYIFCIFGPNETDFFIFDPALPFYIKISNNSIRLWPTISAFFDQKLKDFLSLIQFFS